MKNIVFNSQFIVVLFLFNLQNVTGQNSVLFSDVSQLNTSNLFQNVLWEENVEPNIFYSIILKDGNSVLVSQSGRYDNGSWNVNMLQGEWANWFALGVLPEGALSFCIYDQSGQELSCHQVQNTIKPNDFCLQLVYPYNNEDLTNKSKQFAWSSLLGLDGVEYRIKITQRLSEKSDVMHYSLPAFYFEQLSSFNLNYPVTSKAFDVGEYLWSVEAVVNNRIVCRSLPSRFTIKENPILDEIDLTLAYIDIVEASDMSQLNILGELKFKSMNNRAVNYTVELYDDTGKKLKHSISPLTFSKENQYITIDLTETTQMTHMKTYSLMLSSEGYNKKFKILFLHPSFL